MYTYLIWWQQKTVCPSVSQLNSETCCPVLIALICIVRVKPEVCSCLVLDRVCSCGYLYTDQSDAVPVVL